MGTNEHDTLVFRAINAYRHFAKMLDKRNRGRRSRGESLLKFDPYQGQGRILRELAHTDGVTQAQLAERLGTSPQSLSVALRKLADEGLIERGQDELDKRVRTVFITDEGRAVEHALSERAAYSGSMFEALEDDELAAFIRIIDKVSAHLEHEIAAAGSEEAPGPASGIDPLSERDPASFPAASMGGGEKRAC